MFWSPSAAYRLLWEQIRRKFLLIQRVKGRFLRKVVFKQDCKETDSSVGKESAWNAGDPGSIPGSGRSAGEGIGYPLQYSWASLVVQLVKNPPAMQETWVRSLGWKDPLREEMATHSSILAWKIPWTEKPGKLQSYGVTKSWTWLSDFHFIFTAIAVLLTSHPVI